MIASLKTHIKWMLSGRYGTISSARVLSFLNATFSFIVMSFLLHRELTATTPEMVTAVASSLSFWGPILMGLSSAPYAINKAGASITEIITAIKKKVE